jgi:hypothetical protein
MYLYVRTICFLLGTVGLGGLLSKLLQFYSEQVFRTVW